MSKNHWLYEYSVYCFTTSACFFILSNILKELRSDREWFVFTMGKFDWRVCYVIIFLYVQFWIRLADVSKRGKKVRTFLPRLLTSASQFILEVTISIRLGPLRWVPTAQRAGRRGLNLLAAVRPVELAQWTRACAMQEVQSLDHLAKGLDILPAQARVHCDHKTRQVTTKPATIITRHFSFHNMNISILFAKGEYAARSESSFMRSPHCCVT